MTARSIDGADKFSPPTQAQLDAATNWVRRFVERWTTPNADSLRDLMHPDTANLIPPMTEPGDAEAVVEHFRGLLNRVPDFKLSIVRWAPTGDSVLIEWEGSGTVAGTLLVWRGVDRVSLRGDRMYNGQVYWDTRRLAERMTEAVKAAQAA